MGKNGIKRMISALVSLLLIFTQIVSVTGCDGKKKGKVKKVSADLPWFTTTTTEIDSKYKKDKNIDWHGSEILGVYKDGILLYTEGTYASGGNFCFFDYYTFNGELIKSIDVSKELEYKQIEDAYRTETKKELSKDLEKSFSGGLRKDLLNLISTERRTNENPDRGECEKLADLLINSGEKNWIEDENVFRDVFILCSPEEMVLVGRYYFQKTGNNLIDVIEKKFSGKNRTLLREVVFANIIPHELYAEKINNSIKGLGTNTALLNRVLAARRGVDMPQIKEMYQWKYNETLKDALIGDTSGMYQKLCLYVAEY